MRSFQTKDFDDPSMSTYLIRDGRLYLAAYRDGAFHDDGAGRWRVEGDAAIHERRYALREIEGSRTVNAYSHCDACAPVLVRTDRGALFGDIVSEHTVFVDFALTLRPGEPMQIERVSGTRDDLKGELAERGVYVLRDDEPLAVAHRELKRAREQTAQRRPGRRG